MYPAQDGLVVNSIVQPAIHKLSKFMAFIKVPDAWSGDKDKLLIFVFLQPRCCLFFICSDGYFPIRPYDTRLYMLLNPSQWRVACNIGSRSCTCDASHDHQAFSY